MKLFNALWRYLKSAFRFLKKRFGERSTWTHLVAGISSALALVAAYLSQADLRVIGLIVVGVNIIASQIPDKKGAANADPGSPE